MSIIVSGHTLTSAWLEAVDHLYMNGKQEFNLIVNVADPDPEAIDWTVVDALNALTTQRPRHAVETVANTIFPQGLANRARDRASLYEDYLRLAPRLRRIDRGNRNGLYFERLIDYPLRVEAGIRTNQVETVIETLRRERALNGPRRFVYEVPVHAPGIDRARVAFPCLSYVAFQLDEDRLRMNALYRNQYYIARALGNLLGLSRLQRFVANAAEIGLGPLTMVAGHAELDCNLDEAVSLLTACGRTPVVGPGRGRRGGIVAA